MKKTRGRGGGEGRLQVSLIPMLKQRIAKHTLNSVLKISKAGTLSTVFPTKGAPFHYVLSLYFTSNHSVSLSDLRTPTLFPLKCHFSDGLHFRYTIAIRGCAKDWTVTDPQVQLRSGLFVCVEVLRPSQQLRSCRAGQLPINTVPG